MNYEIIKDEKVLLDFIEWLPELTEDETYYCCLFARSKYVLNKEISHITTDKAQLKRFTSNRSRLFDKIRQLECPLGSYKQKANLVPQEALAIYINPNPRCNLKAARNGLVRLAQLVAGENHGYNMHQEMISEVQKSKSRMVFMDFDFDVSKETLSPDMIFNDFENRGVINLDAVNILESRGGYHVLVDIRKVAFEFKNKWYNGVKQYQHLYSTDTLNKGDNMMPIPGCTQGNFVPKFLSNKIEI